MLWREEKNKLREVIKDLFRERDCVTVVRPVADEADLRNIQKLPYEKLRPQFRSQVEAFVKKVYTFLKPKKIDGATVSGSMFVDLASEYCKAINGSVVPTIHSAWGSAIQHQLRLSMRDAVQAYRAKMNEHAMQHLPMSDDKLRDLHKMAKAEGLKLLLATKLESDPRLPGQKLKGERKALARVQLAPVKVSGRGQATRVRRTRAQQEVRFLLALLIRARVLHDDCALLCVFA